VCKGERTDGDDGASRDLARYAHILLFCVVLQRCAALPPVTLIMLTVVMRRPNRGLTMLLPILHNITQRNTTKRNTT
jgi:hypothetical protein